MILILWYDVTMKVAVDSPEYKYTDRARFHAKWIEEHYPNGKYYFHGKTLTEMLDLEFDGTDWQRPTGEEMHQFIMDKNKYKSVVHYSLKFDSIAVDTGDLIQGSKRLIETNNPVILPYSVPIKVLVTSADVLHSWAVPSLGIKIDAVPGRINQFIFEIKRPGYFYGQCSELCGNMHGYMPINIQAVNLDEFKEWLTNNAEIV